MGLKRRPRAGFIGPCMNGGGFNISVIVPRSQRCSIGRNDRRTCRETNGRGCITTKKSRRRLHDPCEAKTLNWRWIWSTICRDEAELRRRSETEGKTVNGEMTF